MAEREQRRAHAEAMLDGLESGGIVGVATSFVDNSGIVRVKTVPVRQLPHLAAWGAGFSPVMDRCRFDDAFALSGDGTEPVGDLRPIPDLDRLVPLAAYAGWAWAPGDRYQQDGQPHPQDGRLLLQRVVADLASRGVVVKCGFEIEWTLSTGPAGEFIPAVDGPAYGLGRLLAAADYSRELLAALRDSQVEVEQLHPEYGAGQFELSVAPESAVGAADTNVLARTIIRGVGERHGLRTSFSPRVDVAGVGNGGHLHFSLWRDEHNLMTGGEGAAGMTRAGESFVAGILERLPALLTIGCPAPVSYLRLVPSHWAGDYACWGVENREAAIRVIPAAEDDRTWAANVEVKCFDLLANPYLLLAAVIAAGNDGVTRGATLPGAVATDPAVLHEAELAARGIHRLPGSLEESLAAFVADDVLTSAFGPELVESIRALRQSEIDLFTDSTPEAITAANRWRF